MYMIIHWIIQTVNIIFPHLEKQVPGWPSGALQDHYTYECIDWLSNQIIKESFMAFILCMYLSTVYKRFKLSQAINP